MSILVSSKTYMPPPEGLHQAACVDVVDLGMVDSQFGRKHRVRVYFELDKQTESGRSFIISKTYTLSLHEKSTLHKDLRSWRSRAFSPDELKGFDLEKLVGVPCQLFVNHVERDGTVYGNVTAIMKAEKGKVYQASGQYQRARNYGTENQEVADFDDSIQQEDTIPF